MSSRFIENPLNRFASYAYNFRLYTVDKTTINNINHENQDLRDISLEKLVDKGKKVAVIVETGATTLTINELSIETIPIPTEGTAVTNISFDISQPKGYSFAESMAAAGNICGWENYFSEPLMLLEISFKGWDTYPDDNNGPVERITLPIKIVDVATSLDSGGSRYNVQAVYSGGHHTREDIGNVTGSFTIDNCEKMEDFTTKFATALRNEERKDRTKGAVEHTIHSFKYVTDPNPRSDEPKSLADVWFGDVNSGDVPQESADLVQAKDGTGGVGVAFTIPTGARIPKVIEAVLMHSEEVQKMLLKEKNSEEEHQVATTFHVEPKIGISEYIEKLGQYQKRITWHISMKKVPIPENFNKNSADSYRELTDPKISNMSKLYKYYYSGLNTEVLSADIEYTNAFLNKVSRYADYYNNDQNSGKATPSAVTNDDREEIEKNAKLNNKDQFESNATESTGGNLIYVDSVDQASMKTLTNLKSKYLLAKDTETSSASEGAKAADKKAQLHNYQLRLRNIRNQMLLSALTMKLEIRGDPFWLSPFDPTQTEKENRDSSSSKFNLISFVMGYPNENQERGLRDDYTYSGVYMVNSVTSTFSSGRFTQRLECSRLGNIDGETTINNIDNDDSE